MKELRSRQLTIGLLIMLAISVVAFVIGSFADYDIAHSIALRYGYTENNLVPAPFFSVLMTTAIIPTCFFAGIVGSILATTTRKTKFWTWFWRIFGVGGAGLAVYSSFKSALEAEEIYVASAPHRTLWFVIILLVCLLLAGLGVYIGLCKLKDTDPKKKFWVAVSMFILVFFYFCSGEFVKYLVSRPRPRTIFSHEGVEEFRNWWEFRPLYALTIENASSCKSFVSGHAAHTGTYMLMVPLGLSLTKLGKKKYTALVGFIIGAVWCVVVSISRMFAQAHFLTDVSGGVMMITVGMILFYWIMPWVEETIDKKKAD